MRYLFITASLFVASLTAAKAQTVKTDDPKSFPVVYINSDSLVNNYEYYKVMRTQLQDLSQKAQAELAAKGETFQKEVAAYQKNVNNLNATQRATTEKRLAKKQQDLQLLNQNTGKQLQEEEASQNEKLYNRIAGFLKVYAKQKGYKFVLTYSKANPTMLYGDESLDVTKEVLAGLNEDYKTKK